MAAPRPAIAARAGACALGLLALAVLSAGRPPVGEVFQRVLRAVEPGATPEQVEESAGLLARAAGAVPSWLAVRDQGTLGDLREPLTTEQSRVLECAAPLLERERVVGHVAATLGPSSSPGWRLAAIELLRWHARSSELRLLVRLCGEDPALIEPFRDSVCEVARRDAGLPDELRGLGVVSPAVGLALVRAVGSAGEPDGLAWLAEQLGDPDRTDAALQEIGRLARSTPCARADAVAAAVRPFLGSPSLSRRRQAMLALGALHDELSALPLIEALQTDHAGERRTAFAALRQLSGCELPDRTESWRAWFRAEHAWWRGEAEATLERLRSEDDAEVVAAVRSLGERSLRRDELSLHLVPLLRTHPSPTVRRQVTLSLTRLGDPVALRALVMALEDPEEDVRSGAHAGLSSISGLRLPATSRAWTAALHGDD